jgi:hypothetical protein
MRGLDPRICRLKEDGQIKSGHDVVGKSEAGSEAFAGMTMEGRVMRGLDPMLQRLSWA